MTVRRSNQAGPSIKNILFCFPAAIPIYTGAAHKIDDVNKSTPDHDLHVQR